VNGVIEGFVVIGLVIVVGYLLGRSGALGPAAVDVLSRVAFFVAGAPRCCSAGTRAWPPHSPARRCCSR